MRFIHFPLFKVKELTRKFFNCGVKTMTFAYPEARRDETVKDNFFGTEVADPYRWLEDPESEDTKKFIESQNAVTRPFLDSCECREQIRNKITKLWNYPKYSAPFRHGNKYYEFQNTGLQNQSVIFVKDSLEQEGKVFLDPNTLSDDGTVALSGTSFSENGETFAYGLSASGSDWIEIKFKDVKTGNDYPEVLKKVKYSPMTWMHDHKGFFYGAYLEQEGIVNGSETQFSSNQKLYYHELDTDQSKDIVVVEFDDPLLRIGANVSDCGKYLILISAKGCKNNLVHFAHVDPKEKITGKLKLVPIVTELVADYEYVANYGSKVLFRTNKNASNYRLIQIDFDNPKESEWVDIIPENPKDVLDWVHPINNNLLVVCYLQDVKNVMYLYDLDGKKKYEFKLDVGHISSISGKKSHSEMFYSFCSFLTPNMIYKVNFCEDGSIKESLYRTTNVGDFDPTKYETKQVFYESKDKTKIPMFIIHKKDLVKDGKTPCLLYGYGGFNVSLTPSFAVSRIIFIDGFNGVFALANIRGGGEYGDKWHDDGRFAKKQNCFDDFQYAAKYLVKENYTCTEKLTIQGSSNGGLLVAACINQAPELFGAAICQVGVLDMLRYHKFTIGHAWISDYGCADDKEQFQYLYKYSPLHNVRVPEDGKQYPATLLFTADHDDRVVPLHSLKFIAELQYKLGKHPAQKNPIMIRVETRAGHGAGKPTFKIIDELTDIFCFLAKTLNLKFNQ